MSMKTKYDPEDIEALLLNKSFVDLYPEEKLFVLRHINSQEEYAEMRHTLLNIHNAKNIDDSITPSHKIKEDLMAMMAEKKPVGFSLNSVLLFLFPEDVSFYKKPAFQFGIGIILILLTLPLFITKEPSNGQTLLAENATKNKRSAKEIAPKIENTMFDEANTKQEAMENISIPSDGMVMMHDKSTMDDLSLEALDEEVEEDAIGNSKEDQNQRFNNDYSEDAENNKIALVNDQELKGETFKDTYVESLAESTDNYDAEEIAVRTHSGNAINLETLSPMSSSPNKKVSNKQTIQSVAIADDQELIQLLFTTP